LRIGWTQTQKQPNSGDCAETAQDSALLRVCHS
jgi:hypothetical protein